MIEEALDRQERNTLRHAVMQAEKNKTISATEAGFIVTLVDRFRKDRERKFQQLAVLQGELAQLKTNEQIIMNLIDSMVKAAKRDKDRQETMAAIKGHKDDAKKRLEEGQDSSPATVEEVVEEVVAE